MAGEQDTRLSASALAADMPVKAALAPSVAPSWTGFYVGVAAGYGWQDRTVSFSGNDPVTTALFGGAFGGTPPPPASFQTNGMFGGVAAGYNWQINRRFVAGIEADIYKADIDGQGISNSLFSSPPAIPFTEAQQIAVSQSIEWFGTVRPRLGWLANDNLLLYGTAGFAYGHVKEQVNYGLPQGVIIFGASSSPFNVGFSCPTATSNFGPCIVGASSRTAVGWTAGAGAEFRMPGTHLSLKVEYLYVNLGKGDVTAVALNSGAAGRSPSSILAASTTDFNTIRVGLNWKF